MTFFIRTVLNVEAEKSQDHTQADERQVKISISFLLSPVSMFCFVLLFSRSLSFLLGSIDKIKRNVQLKSNF